jgi:hypothetical protein
VQAYALAPESYLHNSGYLQFDANKGTDFSGFSEGKKGDTRGKLANKDVHHGHQST